MTYQLHTDGSCRPNPGPGGWAAIMADTESAFSDTVHGYEERSTNNRMELLAVIGGLQALPEQSTVEVFTDSRYVQRGITEWLTLWRKRGWRTVDGNPVANQDLWQRLDEEMQRHAAVSFTWIKGHASHVLNELADREANYARMRGNIGED